MPFRTLSSFVCASGVVLGAMSSAGVSAADNQTAAQNAAPVSADISVPKEAGRYYVGLRGGLSLMGMDDTATVSGTAESSQDPDVNGYFGLDFGYYTPEGRSRVYYSFERHESDSDFKNSGLSYPNIANLNLLATDYFFLHGQDFSPYVGLHFGYASVKSDSDYRGDYSVSGFIFGLQTGLAWRVSTDITLEAGFRHSMLPSKLQNWQGQDEQGNSVQFQSQQRGVSSLFLAANYRY
ncbi:outer membrane beta-barrel protein (plasmid) [Photobacterium sp. GJ3]|uniref:outer membrane beta-barrel protein n=1 Tax=Photobacterium sp. GJ3 TaxID=2829502 RepID=UPI001B8CBF42|nr:outer membrane beta-barrel protein [Photobacterium sp. GJ3]QUJ69509.1 outer membrane beta-barrel protein [Photobacterium sp. GJ3]